MATKLAETLAAPGTAVGAASTWDSGTKDVSTYEGTLIAAHIINAQASSAEIEITIDTSTDGGTNWIEYSKGWMPRVQDVSGQPYNFRIPAEVTTYRVRVANPGNSVGVTIHVTASHILSFQAV